MSNWCLHVFGNNKQFKKKKKKKNRKKKLKILDNRLIIAHFLSLYFRSQYYELFVKHCPWGRPGGGAPNIDVRRKDITAVGLHSTAPIVSVCLMHLIFISINDATILLIKQLSFQFFFFC